MNTVLLGPAVATALTVYGIETILETPLNLAIISVATALTVYGIETFTISIASLVVILGCNSTYRLRY